MLNNIHKIINEVYTHIKKNEFKGYDPYDCLNSRIIRKVKNKWFRILCTQFLVYFPVNLRPILKIEKGINPKGMGLLLSALSNLKKMDFDLENYDIDNEMNYIYHWLIKNSNRKYSGLCWGYNFPWQDIDKYIPRYEPSIVCTSFVGHGILDYYDVIKDETILDVAESIGDFMIDDLNIVKDDDGLCFSYSPFDNTIVHNANVLGASFLGRLGYYLESDHLVKYAKSSYNFTLAKQNKDGSWYYSIDPRTRKPRRQFDFHQGYILSALFAYLKYLGENNYVRNKLKLGLEFYEKMFFSSGKSYWRYPRKYPVDIHNQVQGIITFSLAYQYFKNVKYLSMVKSILSWTIENMYDASGFFYFQKWPFITNRIEYMRWSQIWGFVSLVHLAEVKGTEGGEIQNENWVFTGG